MSKLWDANKEIERLQARITTLTEALQKAAAILENEGYIPEARAVRAALQIEGKDK